MKTLEWLLILVLGIWLWHNVWAPLAKGFHNPLGTMAETLDKAVR